MRTTVKTMAAVLILIGCCLSLQAYSSAEKIRIIVPQANVRLKPNAESLAILQVPAGTVLTAERYDENWFKTSLPPDKDGFVATGFLKVTDVEIYAEEKPAVKEEAPPVVDKPAAQPALPAQPVPPPPPADPVAGPGKGFFLNLQASFASLSKIDDATFSRVPTYSYMNTIRDNGTLTSALKSSTFGGEFGLGYFFSDKLGIGLSANYFPSRTIDITSSYVFTWKFNSSSSLQTDSNTWSSSGTMSSMPISLNLLFRLALSAKSFLILQAGPSLFLTNTSMTAKTGYGVAQQSSFIIYPYIYTTTYVDWYPLNIANNLKKTIVGFNAGVQFEQKISPSIGLLLSGRYYSAPAQSTNWVLVPDTYYTGHLGNLSRSIASDKSNLPEMPTITTTLNFSFLSISAGICVHL